MEVHAPDHPITGWTDAAKHLAIITVGVFIALALEGIVSWADHRLLVREATANVIAELRSNAKELDGLFAHLEQEKAQLEHADEVADRLLGHKPLDHSSDGSHRLTSLLPASPHASSSAASLGDATKSYWRESSRAASPSAFVHDKTAHPPRNGSNVAARQ